LDVNRFAFLSAEFEYIWVSFALDGRFHRTGQRDELGGVKSIIRFLFYNGGNLVTQQKLIGFGLTGWPSGPDGNLTGFNVPWYQDLEFNFCIPNSFGGYIGRNHGLACSKKPGVDRVWPFHRDSSHGVKPRTSKDERLFLAGTHDQRHCILNSWVLFVGLLRGGGSNQTKQYQAKAVPMNHHRTWVSLMV
jgi:hypothetical protein